MLARLFVFFGGLLVIALCSLLLAPFFVDWAGYRSAFEREASRIIGQPVRVEGTANARILPFPSVTFSNLVIEGADGIPAARIAAFSMDAELAPFLSGEILIFDMRIERADVRLKLAENGSLLWAAPQGDVLSGRTISLENVNVSDSRVTLERAGQAPLLFDGIAGKISAQSLAGPWLADGKFVVGTTPYDARASTGTKEAGETLRLRLFLAPQNGFYEASFDGQFADQVTPSGGKLPSYNGKLDLTAFGQAEPGTGKRQKIADLKGAFSADAYGIKIADAELVAGEASGPYRAEGTLGLSFGKDARFDISLKGQQVTINDNEGSVKSDRVKAGVPLADRFAALEKMLLQIPLPTMPGTVDLMLPTLVIGDTIIRNAVVKAVPANKNWLIERYAVELPGRTIVEGQGELALAESGSDGLGNGLGFSGQMTLATKQPTGFANWLGIKANDAIRALPGAGFSARVDFSAKRQTLRDVEFRAGNTVLRGLIDRQVPEGARPQISLQLAGENANLDVLSGLSDFIGVKSQGLDDTLNAEDIDIALSSAPATGFGFQAEELTSKVYLGSDKIEIQQLKISGLAGADFSVAGSLSRPVLNAKGELDLTIAAVDPLPLLDALTSRFPNQPWLKTIGIRAAYIGTALADASLTTKLQLGEKDGTFIDYRFDAAGLRFSGAGALQSLNDQSAKLTVTGDADNGETLLAGLGVPVGDTITALQLLEPVTFDISTETKSGEIQSGTFKAASGNDRFETKLGAGYQPFSLSLDDAAPYAMAANYGLPGSIYGLPLHMKGNWQRAGSTLKLADLDGAIVDVPVKGDLDLSLGERLKLTGSLSLKTVDRLVADDVIFGPLMAGGDDQAEFGGQLSLPFDADVALAVDALTGFAPLHLTEAKMRMVASNNALRLTDISAGIAGGKLLGSGEARKIGTEATIGFNGAIADVNLDRLFGDAVTGKSNAQIELSAIGSNLEKLKSSISGTVVVSVRDAGLNGVGTTGFQELVLEADARQTPPDAIATVDLAERRLMSGQVQLPQFQSVFTVTSGVARAPRSLLKVAGGTLVVEPKFDFTTGEAEIAAQLQFDVGADATAGAVPALDLTISGIWDNSGNNLALSLNAQQLQGFLGQRALEREEARVEAIQSTLLEKQRLRRENRYYQSLIDTRQKAEADRLAAIEQAAKDAVEAEKKRLADEAKRQADAAAALKLNENEAPANTQEEPEALQEAPTLNLDGLLQQLETAPQVQP